MSMRIGIAGEQQAAGRMADDREVGIVHRGEHPRGHLLPAQAEAAVDRPDDEVEAGEHRVVVVQRAVGQDVGLDPLEHPDAEPLGVDGVDLVRLAQQILGR